MLRPTMKSGWLAITRSFEEMRDINIYCHAQGNSRAPPQTGWRAKGTCKSLSVKLTSETESGKIVKKRWGGAYEKRLERVLKTVDPAFDTASNYGNKETLSEDLYICKYVLSINRENGDQKRRDENMWKIPWVATNQCLAEKDLDESTLRLALMYLIECNNAPAPGFFGAFTWKLHIGYVSLALGWTNMAANNVHSAK